MRLLVVEDDDAIAEALVAGLRREGFQVTLVSTAESALTAPPADLVLLDLGLPDGHGFEVCRQLRSRSAVPIIIGFRELVARIRAVSRRTTNPVAVSGPQLIGELEIDRRSHRVHVAGVEVALTPKEFDLLAVLAVDPGAMVTRRDILAEVWDPHWYGTSKTVDVHIASLRKKLGNPEWIETTRGVGFRLVVPQ